MMYCPKCCKLVAEEKHIFGDRTEYRCPHCGHRIEVVHKPLKIRGWANSSRTV